ncbi:MAG: hypothetical protein BAA01_06680 [Bacillus thermozeamaize]|jgi:hypothetical protein|uniref:DUF4405 domain-containing protein n=1 Tax=Bacillus thermozeamaize TaxID=230954 RepID=A0A1Y3PGI5_9BACI|nr:MAG: hypothetical protein BAA01_06680 [Bacillus thermozeamaize]
MKLEPNARKETASSMQARHLLKGLIVVTLIAAASGILLFLPPFSIWPLYPVTLSFHAWIGIFISVPFFLAILIHGMASLRKAGLGRWKRSGMVLGLAFMLVLATGIWRMIEPELPGWLLVVHIVCGSLVILLSLVHGARVRLDR